MDDRSLREFKDSMFDVYLQLGLGLEGCRATREYLNRLVTRHLTPDT
jgi:hypothetical protein